MKKVINKKQVRKVLMLMSRVKQDFTREDGVGLKNVRKQI